MGVQSNTLITTTVPADRVNSINDFMNSIDLDIKSEIAKINYDSNEYTGVKIAIDETDLEAFIGYKSDDIHNELVYVKRYDESSYIDYITYDPYDAETEYFEGDIVMHEDLCYVCIEDTTGEWDDSKWDIKENNEFGDLVKYDGGYYKCIRTYSGGWDSTKWIEMNIYYISPTVASTSSTIAAGDLSIYAYTHSKTTSNDELQRCITFCINEKGSNKEGIQISYINTTTNNFLIGYKLLSESSSSFDDISTLAMVATNDISAKIYSYTNMFQYNTSGNTIDFLGQSYIVDSDNIKSYEISFLRECSTVTPLSTVSLTDGNYLAIGAHCLAPLDEE